VTEDEAHSFLENAKTECMYEITARTVTTLGYLYAGKEVRFDLTRHAQPSEILEKTRLMFIASLTP
jgi:hypothetical protein